MGKTEDEISWRGGIGLILLILLIGAAIKFGAMSLVLSHDLEKSECRAAYWKARTQGHPSNYCPPDCPCGLEMFR